MVNHVFNVISCLLDFSDNSANISLVVSSGLTQLPLNRSSQKHTHFQQKSLEFISPQWQWTVEALRRSAHQQHLFPPPWFTVGRRPAGRKRLHLTHGCLTLIVVIVFGEQWFPHVDHREFRNTGVINHKQAGLAQSRRTTLLIIAIKSGPLSSSF